VTTTIPITNEFRDVCRFIVSERKSDDDWAEIESDDLVQTENFVGGYDGTERAFCFSFYGPDRTELWFQVTLVEAMAIAEGQDVIISGREPD
jgi:hypothetical protein